MNAQRGFSFIEVLIAMLVLGVSVLAFASLQVRALETTGVSHVRSQAMTLAADMSERMRANPTAIATYRTAALYNGANVPTGAPSTWTSPGTGCVLTANVNSNGCTAVQMATFDINEIEHLAGQLLPAGLVRVALCPGMTNVDCITLAWGGTAINTCANNASPNCVVMQVVAQ